jgi:hypothetical protein
MVRKVYTARNGARYVKNANGQCRFISGASKSYLNKIRKMRGGFKLRNPFRRRRQQIPTGPSVSGERVRVNNFWLDYIRKNAEFYPEQPKDIYRSNYNGSFELDEDVVERIAVYGGRPSHTIDDELILGWLNSQAPLPNVFMWVVSDDGEVEVHDIAGKKYSPIIEAGMYTIDAIYDTIPSLTWEGEYAEPY